MPKVSVVIPAYNAMVYLQETMESVLNQSFRDFEVIVVNDGSSDTIEQWVSSITDPRVKLVSQENQGLAGARNTGILHAQGEYIAFLDADDLWQVTKLEKQVNTLETYSDVALVYTWLAYIDEQGNSTGRMYKNQAEGEVWEVLTKRNIVGCGSVAMVRRSCFEVVGLFDRNLGSYIEDWDMWLRIASRYSFKVVREPLVYYRQHSSSTSRNWEAMKRSFELVIEKAFTNAPQKLQVLKERSYCYASICIAWKAFQSQKGGWERAVELQKKALIYKPWLCFYHFKEYVRLSIAISLMRLLGFNDYHLFLGRLYAIRRRFSSVS